MYDSKNRKTRMAIVKKDRDTRKSERAKRTRSTRVRRRIGNKRVPLG